MENPIQNDTQILHYFGVPETQHAIPVQAKPVIPFFVSDFLLRVMTAIKFDDETLLETNEIGDERAHGLLSLELQAIHSIATESGPKQTFGIGHVGSKIFGSGDVHVPLSLPSPSEGEGLLSLEPRPHSSPLPLPRHPDSE